MLFKWIPTDDILRYKGIEVDSSCYCCGATETFQHLFYSGPVAIEVWAYFENKFGIQHLITDQLQLVLTAWRIKAVGKNHILHLIPILILWFLWCSRNDKKHNNIPFTAEKTIWRVVSYLQNLGNANLFKFNSWEGFNHVADSFGFQLPPAKLKVIKLVKWIPPQLGVLKLNTDGACRGNPGPAAAGGVVRNHTGQHVLMFSEFLGEHTNTYAEIYAIWRGLDLCHSRNFSKIWVETDSRIATLFLSPPRFGHWQLQYLIQRIHNLMNLMEVHITHVYREGNSVADFLANDGFVHKRFSLYNINDTKGKLLGLLRLDKMGYPYFRCK